MTSGTRATSLGKLSTKSSIVGLLAVVAGQFLLNSNVAAQSVADNIRPVGQVCLAGQACVGTTAATDNNVVDTATAVTEVTPSAPAPVVESVEEEVVAAADTGFDVAGQYQMSCFACHASGAAGAPLLGDAEAWNSRMEKGMDAVMTNVINGINAMPAKGLCMDCTDDNLRAIVDYMIAQ